MGRWEKFPKMAERSPADSNARDEWVVTEKLHGANFSVMTEASGSVAFAKRSGVLPATEDFYSFRSQRLDVALAAHARELFAALRTEHADLESCCVFGELCGGKYPHADVPVVPGLQPVQCGIWYSPSLQFVAFDLAVCYSGGRRFFEFDAARRACEEAGFMFAAPIARGNLGACLGQERFGSRLAARLGLPPLECANLAEGVVVRSAREPADGGRAMFKQKIKEFSEAQYSHNDWKASRAGGCAAGPEELPADELLGYEIAAHVTEQRLAAVLSKRGRLDAADKRQCRELLDEFQADVVEALAEGGAIGAGEQALSPPLAAELEQHSRRLISRYVRQLQREAVGDGEPGGAGGAEG